MNRTAIVSLFIFAWWTIAALAEDALQFPNHHLHNFYVNSRTLEHAIAMGYRLVPFHEIRNSKTHPEYRDVGSIRNHNSHICPLRIYLRKSDDTLLVTYHNFAGSTDQGLNPIALANGIRRRNGGRPTKMRADDLKLLRQYGAARLNIDDLALSNVSYDQIQQRFHTSWPLEDPEFRSCNVLCNWQSRKVVTDMIQATLENIPWSRYDALFFDSLTGAARHTTNAHVDDQGAYPTGLDGKLAFVKAVVQFVRDPANTGRRWPYLVFTNIYDPLGNTKAKQWYGTGQLRLDHYYFEKGSKEPGSYLTRNGYQLGTQGANGVIPGTTQPAYVDLDPSGKLVDPDAYLPASLVALDDAYTWSMRVSRKPNFDHDAFFDQHLDACGTAAIQGSWFGWYGEDYVTIRDTNNKLIYTNACQLLRAIPNWDNVRGIPVPPFRTYASTDERRWIDNVYESPHSYASQHLIYSRNPDNRELHVVFREGSAVVPMLPDEALIEACFVDPWFSKTELDAMPSLHHDAQQDTLSLKDIEYLGRGIRIVTTRK